MKVTKIIREYVVRTVNALPKFRDKTSEEIAYDEMYSKIEAFKIKVDDEVKAFVNEAIMRFKTENNIPEDIDIKYQDNYYPVWSSMYNSKIAKDYHKQENARATAKAEAIEEILVNLELGADRKELDEMLKKLAE